MIWAVLMRPFAVTCIVTDNCKEPELQSTQARQCRRKAIKMINLLKKNFALLLAAVFCLSLTACGIGNYNSDPLVVGNDWRVTGVVRGGGIITRDGENTDVLVCIHASDAVFYHDTEEQVLFDSVDYPITLEGDAWEAFQSVGFADLNGDGNSDVAMKFDDGGSELLMVWFWDTESAEFVYQPEESQIGKGTAG